jgi:hypothetical protein
LLINLLCLQTQGLYLEARVDVEVSSGKDDVPKTNALIDKKKASAGDDAKDGGVSSAEPITPYPISSDVSEQAEPSVADRPAPVIPPTGRHGRKRPPPIIKRKHPLPSADQVMTKIELPPYRRPHSSLDLVIVEIIFGRLFEAF